uniref:Ovule protein n=1 Tax=Romanomermis culicivorax TaxID=13658 RepID=A0A915I6P7_ROMCU
MDFYQSLKTFATQVQQQSRCQSSRISKKTKTKPRQRFTQTQNKILNQKTCPLVCLNENANCVLMDITFASE